jgi:hypothetical protein
MTTTIYKTAKGKTKYYATYQSAWKAAIRLNETAVGGTWLFEGDEIGWYLHFEMEAK